jgi:hypothetical protein
LREKRKGPIGRAAGIAEGLAATVRRMQREREPRVLVYDETGYARLVQPDGRGYERLRETAERMVALVDEAEPAAKAKPQRAVAGGETAAEAGAAPRRAKPATKAKTGSAGEARPKPRRARRAATDAKREGTARKGTAKSKRAKAGGSGGRTRRTPRKDDA